MGYQAQLTEFQAQPVQHMDPVSKCRYACDILAQMYVMLSNKGVPAGAYMMARVNDFLASEGMPRLK